MQMGVKRNLAPVFPVVDHPFGTVTDAVLVVFLSAEGPPQGIPGYVCYVWS
jgi:hypothetical protein